MVPGGPLNGLPPSKEPFGAPAGADRRPVVDRVHGDAGRFAVDVLDLAERGRERLERVVDRRGLQRRLGLVAGDDGDTFDGRPPGCRGSGRSLRGWRPCRRGGRRCRTAAWGRRRGSLRWPGSSPRSCGPARRPRRTPSSVRAWRRLRRTELAPVSFVAAFSSRMYGIDPSVVWPDASRSRMNVRRCWGMGGIGVPAGHEPTRTVGRVQQGPQLDFDLGEPLPVVVVAVAPFGICLGGFDVAAEGAVLGAVDRDRRRGRARATSSGPWLRWPRPRLRLRIVASAHSRKARS